MKRGVVSKQGPSFASHRPEGVTHSSRAQHGPRKSTGIGTEASHKSCLQVTLPLPTSHHLAGYTKAHPPGPFFTHLFILRLDDDVCLPKGTTS